ncbi:MAG: NAD(P)H-dependent oxidoreductase [Planctomycetota bacterium]|nr:NAD(P)H-dependent oxidoreductase [Planctomycetota bacterium]
MSIEVLGISGSPIENSNTDRLIQAVLDATELEFEFVKLSQINIRPCLAYKQWGTTGYGTFFDELCLIIIDFDRGQRTS